MKQATLCYLVKENNNQITDICLALKKHGFGQGKWNGVGGKVEENENIDSAMVREAYEEVGVKINDYTKVAEIDFYFPHLPEENQKVHVYISKEWEGEPGESDEMKPKWFLRDILNYNTMWPDDIYWLPQVLAGQLIRAEFTFATGDKIFKKQVEVVKNF